MKKINDIVNKLKEYYSLYDEMNRSKAVDLLEWENGELRNIFAVMIYGAFIGIPSPPLEIAISLLPYMDDEIKLMLNKVSSSHDSLGDLFGMLDID